jgi:hypothetical protein
MLQRFREGRHDIAALLANGLSNEENEVLLTSPFIDQVVPLVMRGIARIVGGADAQSG